MKLRKKSKPPFRLLWITDPWETLDHARDTTLRLAQEALELGIESHWCDVKSIRWEGDRVLLDSREIVSVGPGRSSEEIELGALNARSPLDFSSLQYRTDPPVDLAYQHPLHLLRLAFAATQRPPELVNPASALLLSNEKVEAALLKGLMPRTVVSSQWDILEKFGRTEGKTVLKPLHTAQSQGVELLDWTTDAGRAHAREALERQTEKFQKLVSLQRFLPGIARGETRLWFLDGKLLACAKKLPLHGDFRVNIDQGSGLAAHKITVTEKKSSARIGKHLRRLGVRLAAVDLIDGFVTDFNITSPGLITQIEKITGKNLARPIVLAFRNRCVKT